MTQRASPLRLVRAPEDAPTASSDDYLMGLVAADQEQAFAELVQRYQPRLQRFCEVLLKDRTAAIDATQDVFSRLWEHRRRYRPQGRLRELLFMMARNHCRSAGRKRWVRSWIPLDESPSALDVTEPHGTEGSLERNERQMLVAQALGKLPEKFRIPLALRFLEEMPYEEIARIIGRTNSAARSRIHYGLQELAALLPDEVVSP
jgi:RNA polymerase sigma-70 factor, ECF subfamily